jgi:lipid-binding SYLF domain-containing protein
MVAYAKSQGLYFGVSVDGLKFFTRHDINARTYKFSMMSEMTARDILNGVVVPPPEAEDLYSALHSVEQYGEHLSASG